MHNTSLPQCLVAVVDDESSVRRGLKSLLKSAGYSAQCFQSGEDFLEFDQHSQIDLLILDVKLGRLDGFEVKQRLAESGIDIPVIFISAFADEMTRKRAMSAGAIAFLPKPIDVDTLLDGIHATLVSRGRAQ